MSGCFFHEGASPSHNSLMREDIRHVWGLVAGIRTGIRTEAVSLQGFKVLADNVARGRLVKAWPAIRKYDARQSGIWPQQLAENSFQASDQLGHSFASLLPNIAHDFEIYNAPGHSDKPPHLPVPKLLLLGCVW